MDKLPSRKFFRPRGYSIFLLSLVLLFDGVAIWLPFTKVKASTEAPFPYFCGAFIVLMIWVTVKIVSILGDNSATLEITSEGFHERTSAMKSEFIRWNQVENIELSLAGHEVFVCITLTKDNGSVIKRERKGFFVAANKAMGYGDIAINPRMCGQSPANLESLLVRYWQAWKIQSS